MILNVSISEGFQLRDLEVADAFSLSNMISANSDYFQRFMPKTTAQNLTEKDSKLYIEQKGEQHFLKTQFTFGITEISTNRIIGLVILKHIDYERKQAEFAYCLSKEFGGKGLVSFAVKEVITFAKEILKLEHFIIIAHKTNKPSVGVALNNNFEWTKTLFKGFKPNGEEPLDMELYELKAEQE